MKKIVGSFVFAFLIWSVIIGIDFIKCKGVGWNTGRATHYSLINGCMINTSNGYVPYVKWIPLEGVK